MVAGPVAVPVSVRCDHRCGHEVETRCAGGAGSVPRDRRSSAARGGLRRSRWEQTATTAAEATCGGQLTTGNGQPGPVFGGALASVW